MAKLRNFDAITALKKSAQLMEGIDDIPDDIQKQVVPVIDITPRKHRVCNVIKQQSATNATTGTIYATPADQDFFLVAATIGLIKDATSTSIQSQIQAVIDGVTVSLLGVPSLSLTPQTASNSISFPFPVKIDRGTNITIVNNTNVANITARAGIVGYLVSNPQGN